MIENTLRSSLVLLLVAAVASAGCAQHVASIHLGEGRRLVSTRSEGVSLDDPIPRVKELEGGAQRVRISEQFDALVSVRRLVEQSIYGEHGTVTVNSVYELKVPAVVNLNLQHIVIISDEAGQHEFTVEEPTPDMAQFVGVEVSDPYGNAGWIIAASALGGLLLAGLTVALVFAIAWSGGAGM
jgi:hypothetical protein